MIERFKEITSIVAPITGVVLFHIALYGYVIHSI